MPQTETLGQQVLNLLKRFDRADSKPGDGTIDLNNDKVLEEMAASTAEASTNMANVVNGGKSKPTMDQINAGYQTATVRNEVNDYLESMMSKGEVHLADDATILKAFTDIKLGDIAHQGQSHDFSQALQKCFKEKPQTQSRK